MNIQTLLTTSLQRAQAQPPEGPSPLAQHQARSRAWVQAVAEGFRQEYAQDAAVRVFCKHHAGNRRDFGLNEL